MEAGYSELVKKRLPSMRDGVSNRIKPRNAIDSRFIYSPMEDDRKANLFQTHQFP